MSTITDINNLITANVTQNGSSDRITAAELRAVLSMLSAEQLSRGIKSVADTTALSAVSGADFRNVAVKDSALYEWLSSGTANGTTIFAASGGGVWSKVFSGGVATAQLATPVLALSVISDTQINATWAAVTDASNYQLYRATVSDFSDETLIYDGSLLLFNSTGLTAATTYYFRLKARGYERMNSAFDSDSAATTAAAAPELITANRIFDHDFDEGAGQRVFNKVGPNTANNNLLSMSEQYLLTEGTFFTSSFQKTPLETITGNYAANKDGKNQAYRVQTGAGAGVNGTYGTPLGWRLQGIAFPAGATKMLAYVKSATGSAQTMRMAYDNGDLFSADLNVTTAWTQVEFSFTHAGGAKHLHFVSNGTGGAALDILIDQLMIIDAAGSTTYITPKLDFCFGKYGTAESIDPTWNAVRGVNLNGTQFAYAITDVAHTPTSFSVYVVAKANSASTTHNYPIATAFNDKGFQIRWGVGGTADSGILTGFKFSNSPFVPVQTLKLADDAIHIVAGIYDEVAGKAYLYVDGLKFGEVAATGLDATSIKRMLLSDTDEVGGRYHHGTIYKTVGFDVAHTPTQIANETAALKAMMVADGFTMAANDTFIITVGDSLSDVDQGGTWPRKAMRLFTTNVLSENVAVVGRTMKAGLNSILQDVTLIDSWYDASRTNNILSLFIGANDVATPGPFVAADFVADLKAFCLARRAVGWVIVLGTLLPNSTNNSITNRNAVNPLIVADTSFYDERVDLHLVTNLGADADCTNTTYYESDGVHLKDAGNELLKTAFKTAYDNVIV